jgi:iron(III) transport system substrate-binding protein
MNMLRGAIFRNGYKALLGGVALALGIAALPVQAQPAPAKGWEQDWNKTVAAAKKEGQLIVSGPSGSAWRDALMMFEEAYPGIKLKITPSASRDFWPRVVLERGVKQYLWDLRVGGPDAQTYDLKAKGVLAPVRELLVLPEVVDGSKWYGGIDGLFLDKEDRYFMGFAMYTQTIGHYNSKLITEPVTVEKLIDPKYKGKISMADPRGGSSNTTLAILYRKFGRDYVKKLLEQKPVIASQSRQQMDWMSAGRYPIAIGIPTISFVEAQQRGVNVDHYIKLNASAWSQGVGGIQLIDKAPHPNAAKVFINWIATRDVQNRLMKMVELNSRRNDVPVHDPAEALDVTKLDEYIGGQEEATMPYRDKAKELLDEMHVR